MLFCLVGSMICLWTPFHLSFFSLNVSLKFTMCATVLAGPDVYAVCPESCFGGSGEPLMAPYVMVPAHCTVLFCFLDASARYTCNETRVTNVFILCLFLD